MWLLEIQANRNYVIDFIQSEGRRIILPRLQEEPLATGTCYTSKPYLGKDLTEWLRSGELSDHVKLADGTGFKLGGHGEWITDFEFETWKNYLHKHGHKI